MKYLVWAVCILSSLGVSGQKIKNDTQAHLIKTYPTFNLPEDVFTYDVDVIVSDGTTLDDYNLSAFLRGNSLKLNYFKRDSLKGRLHLEIFVEARPYDQTYTTTVDPFGLTVYTPVIISNYAGSFAVYLDHKMIDYKRVDFSGASGVAVNPIPGESPSAAFVVGSPLTAMPVDANNQLSAYTSTFYDQKVTASNGSQITRIFGVAAAYFKNTFDINYSTTTSTLYKVKTKDGEYIGQDTTYTAVLALLKTISIDNYASSLKKLKPYLEFWKAEKSKFNDKLPAEAPFVWAMTMNLATVSELLEDYKNAFAYWKEADYIGLDRKESSQLRSKLQNRANPYDARYDENGVLKRVNVVYLDRLKPEEDYRIRYEKERREYELKMKRDLAAKSEAEKAAEADRYKYILIKQPGTVETLDGKVLPGLISYSSDLMTMTGLPYNNRVYLYDKNNKDSDKHAVYNPDKLKRFTLADGSVYESVEIELNAIEKAKNLMMSHKRFYKVIYKSAFITLHSYNSHDVHQHTFKLAGEELGHCTGFGDFQVNPNQALAQLLKQSPVVSEHASKAGRNIFTDQSLIQLCESYTLSLKK
ncbi:MAG: hypothetical protein H7282_08335 [Cytophagaceae bacterium]|nr:hypothetical protein [Cytophagaceae bacterium]